MMKSAPPRRTHQVGFWRNWNPALLCTCAGGALGLITVILSAINAISAQQAIAMALPAGVTTVGGQINLLVADSWTAWRRGFRQGCETGLRWFSHGAPEASPGKGSGGCPGTKDVPSRLYGRRGSAASGGRLNEPSARVARDLAGFDG